MDGCGSNYMNGKKALRFMENNRKKWICRILNAILIVALVYIYGHNIPYLHTLFELCDEAVYIWNAEYFLGKGSEWQQIALTPYYGYGYSFLLVPLVQFATTGVQLIRGAYVINVICVVGIFLILYKILTEISEIRYSLGIPFIAFASCLTPFIATNTIKILCEVFLAFWYCLVVLLLYLAFAYKKKIFFVLLGISGIYIFFIHSRAIVITLALFGLLFIIGLTWQKQKYLKLVLLAIVIAAGALVILYTIKNNIIVYKEGIKQVYEASTEDANLLSARFANLKYLMPTKSFLCFWTKVLYVIYASGGVILPGGICMIKNCVKSIKVLDLSDKKFAEIVIKIFIIFSFILMLIACTMLGQGGDIRTTFYGRYYEYMLPVIICICTYSILYECKTLSRKSVFGCAIFVVATGILTIYYCMNYLDTQRIIVDTARVAAVSKAIVSNNDLHSMLLYIVVISTGILFSYVLFFSKKYCRYLIIPIVVLVLWSNSTVCIDKIKEPHNNLKGDTEIAMYILECSDLDDVYVIEDDSLSEPDYQRIQILLKNKKVNTISQEESEALNEHTYVLVSSKSEYPNYAGLKLIMQGFVFTLYQK